MASMTETELLALTVAGLKRELRTNFGVANRDLNNKTKAVLRNDLRSKVGLPVVNASGGRSTGGGSSTTTTTTQTNTTVSQARADLIAAFVSCGLPQGTAEQFVDSQGLDELDDLKDLSPDTFEDTIARHNKAMTGANEQHKIISSIRIKKMEALVHKVRVWNLTGTKLTLNEWSTNWDVEQALTELDQFRLQEKQRAEPKDLKEVVKEDDLYGPGAHDAFNQLDTNLGQRPSAHGSGSTIGYVCRSLNVSSILNPTTAQRLHQGLPLTGPAFTIDNGRVYDLLEGWTQGTKLYDHVKPFRRAKDGRQAYLTLRAMFLGQSSTETSLIQARKQISDSEGVTYCGELAGSSGMPWANYVGILNGAYIFIEEHTRDTFSQETRVDRLVKGINGDAAQQQILIIACEHVQNDPKLKYHFHEAASFLQTKIQIVYAAALANKTRNNQSIKETNTTNTQEQLQGGDYYHGGRGGRGGRGRGGRGGGRFGGRFGGRGDHASRNKLYDGHTVHSTINGVDVRDELIYDQFDPSVFLGDVRQYVLNRRRVVRNSKGQQNSQGGSGKYYSEAQVKEMITRTISEVDAKRQAGGDNNPRDDKKAKGISISPVTTGERRSIRAVKKSRVEQQGGGISTLAKAEIDSRADTCVLGCNFAHISDTGQACNVNGFHGSFDQISDVPIVDAATGWIHPETGKLYILMINQGLWMPNMDHSLINPNQLRDFEVDVSDNPYDINSKFGITHEDVFIPFLTKGATIFFETFKPTKEQLEDPNNIVVMLTDQQKEWDPQTVDMARHRTQSIKKVNVSIMAMDVAPDQKGEYTDSFDATLGNVSGNYVPSILSDRIIKSVVIDPNTTDEFRKINAARCTPRTTTVNGRRVGISETFSSTRHSKHTPERAAVIFGCSLDKARKTLNGGTLTGTRYSNLLMSRRFPRSTIRFQSEVPKLNGRFYMDWVKSNTKSIHGDTGAFYIGDGRYVDCYPRKRHTSEDAAIALSSFCMDTGTPGQLKVDSAAEFTGRDTEFNKMTKKMGINVTYAEPDRHELNLIDNQIRENKKKWHDYKATRGVPARLWPYGIEHAAQVQQILAPADGTESAFQATVGTTPDLTELLDFAFYDPVWYWKGVHPSIGDDCKDIGRWLGISKKVGTGMCYYILTREGKVISESTVQHVTMEDMRSHDIQEKLKAFDKEANEKLSDENCMIETKDGENTIQDPTHTLRHLAQIANDGSNLTGTGDSPEVEADYQRNIDDNLKANDEAEFDQLDNLIGATVKLDRPDGPVYGKVTKRCRDDKGEGIGTASKNVLLDTREYDVELSDGTYEKFQANTIAENIFAQTDDEGRESLLLDEIYGHRKDGNAIPRSRGMNLDKYGMEKKKITTAGWHIKVKWTDGSTDELPLSVVKESNPIQLAEYAVAAGITDEPAFAWWVPHALRTRRRIIKQARVIKKASKYWRTTSKFGIALPKTVEEALQLDKDNGNTFWRDALKKEMSNVAIAFRKHEDHTPKQVKNGEAKSLIGYTEIKCHIVFDVKLDFTRKARFVANGQLTEAPACMTYSSVVSRESVRLAFLIAAMNDLEISSTDVGNAYLNAPCREKVWYEAGLEWGLEDKGKVMVIERALYGLKSSGAAWRAMFSDFIINQLGFQSTMVDQDVYRRRSTYKDANGTTVPYYELLLVYVDDVLLVSKNPDEVMEKIGDSFRLKDGWDKPTSYLGAETFQHRRSNGAVCWALGSGKYVRNLVSEVKTMLDEDGKVLKKGSGQKDSVGPLHPDYKPELDTSELLNTRLHSRYQQIIGGLRWAVELGRVDINVDVAIMSQYLAAPREGHLEAVYDIIRYLSLKPDRRLLMNPKRIEQTEEIKNSFNLTADWKEFYGEMKEEDPHGMPTPLGEAVKITTYVDANHANNVITRRSQTGILIFVNSALIVQHSKKQNTVESATFGAEMVAMRAARDLTVALRIKLKMFGVPIDGPADFFCDNDSVVKNTSIPSSVLAKKHNSVNFHIIRESAAAGILRVTKIPTKDNKADALTKILPQYQRNNLLNDIMYYPSEINNPEEMGKQPSV